MTTTAIQIQPSSKIDTARAQLLKPVATPVDLIENHKVVAELIREALHDGKDYGRIRGTGDRKVLLKAGAERLAIAFGLSPEFEIAQGEIDHDRMNIFVDKYSKDGKGTSFGLYRYVVKCRLMRDGESKGEGMGSCSTLESKYISRPRDCENTVLKMAKKRAFVDAVLTTLSLSDRFSQDVDDDENEADDNQTPSSAPPPPKKTAPPPQYAELKAKSGVLLDELGYKGDERQKRVWAVLSRMPASVEDIEAVISNLEHEQATRALAVAQANGTQADDDALEGEVVDE